MEHSIEQRKALSSLIRLIVDNLTKQYDYKKYLSLSGIRSQIYDISEVLPIQVSTYENFYDLVKQYENIFKLYGIEANSSNMIVTYNGKYVENI